MRCHWMWSFDKKRLETGAERPLAKPRKGEERGEAVVRARKQQSFGLERSREKFFQLELRSI